MQYYCRVAKSWDGTGRVVGAAPSGARAAAAAAAEVPCPAGGVTAPRRRRRGSTAAMDRSAFQMTRSAVLLHRFSNRFASADGDVYGQTSAD